jgi:hypothetical protein
MQQRLAAGRAVRQEGRAHAPGAQQQQQQRSGEGLGGSAARTAALMQLWQGG